jgi:hypothetical protein
MGANSAIDPNQAQNRLAGQTVNMDGMMDKGYASLLIPEVNAQARNSYNNDRYASQESVDAAAQKYSTLDLSGWLDQYKQKINPYISGYSSQNPTTGFVKRDYMDDVENALSTTDTPEGYNRRQLDAMRYELVNSANGKSTGPQYYGVDDVLRNQYRGTLGGVDALSYQAPQGWTDEYGGFQQFGQKTPEQVMWEKFLTGREDAGNYTQGERKLKEPYKVYGNLMHESLPDDMYDISPTKQAFKWGDSLYDNQEAANAAREAQIMGRPGQYAGLMEKLEAAGEGGLDPQNWQGNYGGDNAFSGGNAIHQLGGKAFMMVDPRTGEWSTKGYEIDPAGLSPQAHMNQGFSQDFRKGKASKPWKKAGDGKLTVTQGGNASWRDYGENAGALAQMLRRTEGGKYLLGTDDIDKIPEFYNRNKHLSTRTETSVPGAKNSKSGLFNNVFNFMDPIMDKIDPGHDMMQNTVVNNLGFQNQQQAFSTIAPIIISAFAMGADGGAGAAAGAGNAAGTGAATAGAAGTAAGAAATANALGTGLSWGQLAAGLNAVDAASNGNWGGALMGGLGAAGVGGALGNVGKSMGLSPMVSRLGSSAIMGGIGGGIDASRRGGNFLNGAATGALGSLVGGALGGAGTSLGLDRGVSNTLGSLGSTFAKRSLNKKRVR